MLSLSDILVVSIEQAVAAPMCSLRLADAGARVIKVEPPGGETARHYDELVAGESTYFTSLNRGKESIELRLRDSADRALLDRILGRADVFIRNTAPGSMERLGLGASDLAARHDRLIVVDFVGYGQDTAYRDMKAYDLLVQAEAGLCSVTGTPEDPAKVGVSIADMGTGLNAYAAVLEALIRRESTGRGSTLELAMFDTVAEWMSVPLLHFEHGKKVTMRHGMAHASIYPYRPYPCRDGEIVMAVQNNAQWNTFCEQVLQEPVLADDPRFATNALRVSHRDDLDAYIIGVTQALTVDDVIARLEAAGTSYARFRDVRGLSDHPALRRQSARLGGEVVQTVASPLAPPGGMAAKRIPASNQDGDAIRQEFSQVDQQ